MRLRVDRSAITRNAARVNDLAANAGLGVSAVLKEAFTTRAIIEAIGRGGIDHFCLSSTATAPKVRSDGPQPQLVGLTLPDDCREVFELFGSSLHVGPETVRAMAAAADATTAMHTVWLGVRTCDGREGLAPADVIPFLSTWRHSQRDNLVLGGLMGTWGCFQDEVPPEEMAAMFDLAREAGHHLNVGPLPVSLGGSVLLPALRGSVMPKRTRLRIGEAILIGTIPGGDGAGMGLERPFSIEAKVCAKQSGSNVLVNVGTTTCEPSDMRLKPPAAGAILKASSETMSIALEMPLLLADSITFDLGFKSALRAMGRRTIVPDYLGDGVEARAGRLRQSRRA